MATLKQATKKAKSVNPDKLLLTVVKDNEAYMLDLNTDEQLFKRGIDSAGDELAEYRSPEYAELKRMLNPNNVTDLKLTGDFHKSFYLDAKAFPLVIDARDAKTNDLIRKYGPNIFGLTDKSQSDFNNHILPDLRNALRRGLGIL